jgi:hypothetical protein
LSKHPDKPKKFFPISKLRKALKFNISQLLLLK